MRHLPPHLVRQYALGLGMSEPIEHGGTFRLVGQISLEIEAARVQGIYLPSKLARIAAGVLLEIERGGERLAVSLDPAPSTQGEIMSWVPASSVPFVREDVRAYPGDLFHLEGINVGPEPERFRGVVLLDVVLTRDVKTAASAPAPSATRKAKR